MADRFVPNTVSIRTTTEAGQAAALNANTLIGYCITHDTRFNSSGAGIRASARMEAVLLADEKGSAPWYRFSEGDWKLLCEALESPQPMPGSHAFPVMPARRLLPMIDAILGAGENEPAVVLGNGAGDSLHVAESLPS